MSTMKIKSRKPIAGRKNKLKEKLKTKKKSKFGNKPKSQLTTTIEVADDSINEIDDIEPMTIKKSPTTSAKVSQNGNVSKKKNKSKLANKKVKEEEKVQDVALEDGDFSDDLDDEDDDDENEEMTGLDKDTLERLKQKDPDFYKYLQQHDKELLDFDDDDGEADEDILDNVSEGEEQTGDTKTDKEDDRITLNKVKQWRKVLQSHSSKAEDLNAIKSIIKAFRKTVNQTTDIAEDFKPSSMSMLNPSVFNAIINTVLVDLIPALLRFLRLQNVLKSNKPSTAEIEAGGNDQEINQTTNRGNFYDPRRSRNWKRVQSSVKVYLTDVLKMLNSLSADARASFERHILELSPFFNAFPHLIKRLIKRSIDEWCGVGGSEDRNRVLAYLVLHRTIRVIQSNDHLTSNERQSMINQILRKLYMSYVAVARNTNESSIAQISFMKNSLVELYRLDDQLAYQHAFIFIRQLAINLRGSLILKEKNSLKTVYNWQFVHSVLLWSQLICSAHNQTDVLDPLISPLVMVITGTIKLLPTIKFIPLRFHLIRALIKLSAETSQFIPVLRYFLEIYSLFDPNKVQRQSQNKSKPNKNKKTNQKDDKKVASEIGKPKSTKFQSKVINFEVMLKVGKEQTSEVEFVQKVFDKFYTNCLQYVASQSASIAFPEMVTIFLHQSRKFIQTIRLPKERTMMKQLMDKIQENSNFIFQKRKSVRYSIQETANITAWERQLRQSESTPLAKFYKQFKTFKVSNDTSKKSSEGLDSMDQNVHEGFCAELKDRAFNMESDLKSNNKKKDTRVLPGDDEEEEMDMDMDMDEDDQIDDLDDDELAQLEDFDDEDDLDEEIEFGEDDEVELTEEEFAKLQKKIEKEEQKLRNIKDEEDSEQKDAESGGAKKRKRKNKNKKKKKPRKLNNDLQLEGAFDMSSEDDDD